MSKIENTVATELLSSPHRKISPSLLARKILCPAYVPAPLLAEDRLRFLGFHAMATLQVIGRHLRTGYCLKAIEKWGNGFRIDLVFESSTGRIRRSEVKSAKQITEVHRIQAALYWDPTCDEIVVSNGETDIVLTDEYIQSTQRKAKITLALLTNHPQVAASTFKPNPALCRICANSSCLFLSSTGSSIVSLSQDK
jgi:hypothetical protein